jgi:hypothetical protein
MGMTISITFRRWATPRPASASPSNNLLRLPFLLHFEKWWFCANCLLMSIVILFFTIPHDYNFIGPVPSFASSKERQTYHPLINSQADLKKAFENPLGHVDFSDVCILSSVFIICKL